MDRGPRQLAEYTRKRDFRKTPEPNAAPARRNPESIFVVQKHDATRLHYDLRLEIDGVLVSWAVPKGPSLDPSDKRLAVHVEDHPLDYASFEGVIPKGQYGGGPVIVWDRGEWTPDDGADPLQAITKGKLSFTLRGEKLRGGWTLTRMRRSKDDRDNWLLIKRDDEFATEGDSIVETKPASVLSGRTIGEVAAVNGATRVRPALDQSREVDASGLEGARTVARMPEYTPQLCTLAERAPGGDEWLHEIKLDGYRLLARKSRRGVRLLTRSGKDWTHRFPPIVDAIEAIPCETCVIDGEATIVDGAGRTSFQRLQNAIKARRFDDLAFFVFDLLYLDGHDLTRSPLSVRTRALRSLITDTSGTLRYSEHIAGNGPSVFRTACELGLEGIVSKRIEAPYVQSRSRDWLKIKCTRRQEFVIIGWSPPAGSRKHFGALLLGARDADGRLVYTGRVGTGFTSSTLKDLSQRMRPLARMSCPADTPPTREERKGAHWVAPSLVAEVEFTEWTDDRRLRHPVFRGLREDKPADEVRIERATQERGRIAPATPPRVGKGSSRMSSETATIAGVTLTNPDRVLYPHSGITKRDLAEYYESIAGEILPHLAGRPLSVVRCPQGRAKQCFFQKHIRDSFGDAVRPIKVRESDGLAEYISVDSVQGLISLVQFGVLEIHPWGATERDLDRPDVLTFDLDPGEGVSFDVVKAGARTIRDILKDKGLTSFLKTTGGKGLHVVVPIEPRVEWDLAKAFCASIAKNLSRDDPKRYIAKSSKAARRGKVFIDYLRNSRGATSIAPYSTRARPGAPVAAPLRWDELRRLEDPAKYTLHTMRRRLARLRDDPWSGDRGTRQSLVGLEARSHAQGVSRAIG